MLTSRICSFEVIWYLLSHQKKINHETHQIHEHYCTKTNLIEQHAYFASFYIIFFRMFRVFRG